MAQQFVIGIDVGTGSARAGVFDLAGRMAGTASQQIKIWRPEAEYAEQSSEDIWRAVRRSVNAAMEQAGASGAEIIGLAFDATCSLVAVDGSGRPVTMSPTGRDEQNIIMWMDHRATAEAHKLTEQGHPVIKYLGGTVSPEHQIPKLMWVRKNLPETWSRSARFFDLPDWLGYRATGRDVRSLCTTVCKWTYMAHEKRPEDRWNREFFRKNGLQDLLRRDMIGTDIQPMGNTMGGLTAQAARELGLEEGTPVAVGIIDAHSGGVGVLGMQVPDTAPSARNSGREKMKKAAGAAKKARAIGGPELPKSAATTFDDVVCLIGGTSSCHMAVSPKARFVRGVWGPYYSAMIPDWWLNEGGQSAVGSLIDYVIETHPRYNDAKKEAKAAGISIFEWLNRQVDALARREKLKHRAYLTRHVHVYPDFLGNRSPKADPDARGVVHGLSLYPDLDDMARLYYATVQATAYGTRDILDALNARGYDVKRLHVTGGHLKNPLWLQEHADATGCTLVLPKEPEGVLLGAAILAAVGAGAFENIPEAMAAMSSAGSTIQPNPAVAGYHAAKMKIHESLYRDQKKYNEMTGKAAAQ